MDWVGHKCCVVITDTHCAKCGKPDSPYRRFGDNKCYCDECYAKMEKRALAMLRRAKQRRNKKR